jgi:hypothetical protein
MAQIAQMWSQTGKMNERPQHGQMLYEPTVRYRPDQALEPFFKRLPSPVPE